MSAAVESRVLADLEARAGASDTDRTAWLVERAGGATATQVRDLYIAAKGIGRPYSSEQQIIDEKIALLLAETDAERDAAAAAASKSTPYTSWGKDREPVIAEQLRRDYGMQPESRVFRSLSNLRHLASPDGVRVDMHGRIEVAEIKTSGKPVPVGSAAYVEKGYGIQQQWVMGVLGADRSLYAWELREGRPGEFESGHPFGVDVEWVEFDAALFAELVVLADHFLERLDAALAAARAGEGPVIDEELDTLAVNYLSAAEVEKSGKTAKETAYRAIWDRLDAGEPVVQESFMARVSWSPEIVEEKPVFETDAVAARKAAPAGLYELLEQAEDDARHAQEALEQQRLLVGVHENEFVRQTGVERVVVKRAALRVTPAPTTKQTKEKAA